MSTIYVGICMHIISVHYLISFNKFMNIKQLDVLGMADESRRPFPPEYMLSKLLLHIRCLDKSSLGAVFRYTIFSVFSH